MVVKFAGKHRFLSNFANISFTFASPFSGEAVHAATCEHAYQAFKAEKEEDFFYVLEQQTPGRAKREGRNIKARDDWEVIKVAVMEKLVREKFQQNNKAMELLLETEGELIEGNTWGDRFYGQVNGEGKNILGKILMRVRWEEQNWRRMMRFTEEEEYDNA